MDRYIGLDVHAQSTTVAVMGPSGKHLKETVVETHGKVLVEMILSFGGTLHVCFEEGMHAEWLHELLEGRVHEAVIIIPPKREGSKSDARDAWWLADQLRKGIECKRVYKSKLTALREAVRAYDALTKHSTRTKLQFRFLAVGRGIPVERTQVTHEEERALLLQQLPDARRKRAALHAALVDDVSRLREKALKELQGQAKKHPDVQRLMDVPGIGLVLASQIVTTIVTPHRFRSRAQLWSYAGLGIKTRASAEWKPGADRKWERQKHVQTRGLTQGNPTLKNAFKSAARVVIQRYPEHPWTLAFQKSLAEGKRSKLMELTLARKIAATVLHIWQVKEVYDVTRHKIQDAA